MILISSQVIYIVLHEEARSAGTYHNEKILKAITDLFVVDRLLQNSYKKLSHLSVG